MLGSISHKPQIKYLFKVCHVFYLAATIAVSQFSITKL